MDRQDVLSFLRGFASMFNSPIELEQTRCHRRGGLLTDAQKLKADWDKVAQDWDRAVTKVVRASDPAR